MGRDCDRARLTYATWVRVVQTLAWPVEQTSFREEVVRSRHDEKRSDNWKVGRRAQGSCGVIANGVGATCWAIRLQMVFSDVRVRSEMSVDAHWAA